MLKFLLTPKWIALTLIAILLQPALYSLSQWQWHRLHQREAYNKSIVTNENQSPLTLSQVLLANIEPDGQLFRRDAQWSPVKVAGEWYSAGQVLVRKQSYESNLGFWVVTPFVTQEAKVVLVNRGWIPAAQTALTSPSVQPVPNGTVTLTGRLRIVEPRTKPKPSDLPIGQVDRIQPAEIAPDTAVVTNGYLELISSTPESMTSDLSPILPPEINEGPHRSYAWQWIIFAIMTIIGYVILVRKEIEIIRTTKTPA